MDWWKDVFFLEKVRKRDKRDKNKKDVDKWKDMCAADTERKKEERSRQNDIEKDYEKLNKKHKQRTIRIQRSGKEKLQQQLQTNKKE